ncbi:MAG: glutathione S-transferase family protein, partial [Lentilitoribacter sp.]
DGVIIWESVAITLYLGETFGTEKALFPESGPGRGGAMKWVVWSNLNLADAAGKVATELPPGAPGAVQQGSQDFVEIEQRRPDALPKARQTLHHCFKILNDALAARQFLLNDYSLVDTHMFVLVAWTLFMELDLCAFPHVEAWFARCAQRPVLAAMMSDEQ